MTSNAQSEFTLPLSLISERRRRKVFAPTKFPSVELVVVWPGMASGESSVTYHAWRSRPNLSSPSEPQRSTVGGATEAALGIGRL